MNSVLDDKFKNLNQIYIGNRYNLNSLYFKETYYESRQLLFKLILMEYINNSLNYQDIRVFSSSQNLLFRRPSTGQIFFHNTLFTLIDTFNNIQSQYINNIDEIYFNDNNPKIPHLSNKQKQSIHFLNKYEIKFGNFFFISLNKLTKKEEIILIHREKNLNLQLNTILNLKIKNSKKKDINKFSIIEKRRYSLENSKFSSESKVFNRSFLSNKNVLQDPEDEINFFQKINIVLIGEYNDFIRFIDLSYKEDFHHFEKSHHHHHSSESNTNEEDMKEIKDLKETKMWLSSHEIKYLNYEEFSSASPFLLNRKNNSRKNWKKEEFKSNPDIQMANYFEEPIENSSNLSQEHINITVISREEKLNILAYPKESFPFDENHSPQLNSSFFC